MALTNYLSNLKKHPSKLNFNYQHFEITKVIFHIKIANCWMDKLCNRRWLFFSCSLSPLTKGQPPSQEGLASPVFPLWGRERQWHSASPQGTANRKCCGKAEVVTEIKTSMQISEIPFPSGGQRSRVCSDRMAACSAVPVGSSTSPWAAAQGGR